MVQPIFAFSGQSLGAKPNKTATSIYLLMSARSRVPASQPALSWILRICLAVGLRLSPRKGLIRRFGIEFSAKLYLYERRWRLHPTHSRVHSANRRKYLQRFRGVQSILHASGRSAKKSTNHE